MHPSSLDRLLRRMVACALLCACGLNAFAAEAQRVIRIGVENKQPPLSFVDDKGRPSGYAAEFLQELAKAGNLKIEIVPGFWTHLQRKFQTGEIDGLANTLVSKERMASMDFTIGHAYVRSVAYIKRGSKSISSKTELKGKRVAVLSGTMAHTTAVEEDAWGAELVVFKTPKEILNSVVAGQCYCALYISTISGSLLKDSREFETCFINDITHSYRIAVRKGDSDTLLKLNDAIVTIRNNGAFDRIYSKWIGPIEPRPLRLADLRPYLVPVVLGLGLVVGIIWWQRSLYSRLAKDVEARKRAEEQLRTLSLVVEQSPASIIITDTDGIITYANPRCVDISGYSLDQLLGKRPNIMKSGITAQETYAEIWKTITAGGTWRGDLINRKKNGELFIERTIITPVKNSDGLVAHYMAIKEDITERKRAEGLRAAKEAAEQANIAKSRFLAMMSHEIRTPMNGVIGMTSLLLDTELTATQREFAETIRSSGNALLTIINDILDFSKIEAGKLELENTEFSVCSCIEAVFDLLSPRATEKKIEMVCELGNGMPDSVRGDPTRLRQIITNLVGNAIKFTEQGKISLSAHSRELPNGKCELDFSVLDTGIGIEPEALKKIFMSFTQAEASTTRKFGGTGLGLAISKRLVELMGGSIWVDSTPGQGSVFRFTVVVEKGSGQLLPKPFTLTSVPKGLDGQPIEPTWNPRVLVAEDNLVNRRIALLMLGRLGFNPDVAQNGLEALEAATRTRYDIVFMDVHMPEMDGLEATRRLREKNSDPRTRPWIIALTANAMRGDREICIDAGMDDYLTKPLKSEDLSSAIERAKAARSALQKQMA